MTAGNDFHPEDAPEPVLFSALLTPHRSLNRTGFVLVMAFLSAISFAAGVAFLMMGAWPVFGFFGLDVLAIYWAFKINYRRARASEEISVTPSELRVRRISHRGHVMEWKLNPLWVQLDQIVARGIRHRATLSGLQGPAGVDRKLSGPGRKGQFFQVLKGWARGRPARHHI